MSHLPEEHLDAFKYVRLGGFSVQLSNSNSFGRVPVDQTCKETVNKDTETLGGTKGFSLKLNAVSKYYLVAEYRSTFLRQLKVIPLKLFYYQTFLKLGVINIHDMNIKKMQ